MGKIVYDKSDYYSQRVHKKDQKSSLIEEAMADRQQAQYRKRKFVLINYTFLFVLFNTYYAWKTSQNRRIIADMRIYFNFKTDFIVSEIVFEFNY